MCGYSQVCNLLHDEVVYPHMDEPSVGEPLSLDQCIHVRFNCTFNICMTVLFDDMIKPALCCAAHGPQRRMATDSGPDSELRKLTIIRESVDSM